ncbi:MAG: antifreeze protein, partial [Alphaproteobacteria bacterium]
MWAGSSRDLIERLLPRLPAAIESRSVRALTRRLLLSIARSPAGEGQESLLVLRAERLAAMGEYAAVTKLLGAMPAKMNGQLARLRLDGSLLAGDQVGACDEARKLARESPNPYAYKVLIFCQAAAGDRAGAQLGLALLDEQGTDDDPAFPALVALVLGEPGVKV